MLLALILVGSVVLAVDEGRSPPPKDPADRAAYEAARGQAGRDAAAQVRLALWCEARGMTAERMKHLALAVLYDPSNALARGLMGLVADRGRWERPEDVGRRLQDDPARRALIRDYLERRARTALKPDAQARLAAWCRQNGLIEQAIAHETTVVRLDPSREAVWRRLGYKKQGDRWVKSEELAAERLEAERQKHADKQWRPKLERLRDGLESKDPARRAKAETGIAAITDPRAVPMIWAVLVRGGARHQMAAIQMLGQIDGPAASNALAALAVFNPSAAVRGRAIETLARRDPRDVIGKLINLVRKPFQYEIRRPGGPGSTGELVVEGERFNVRRLYQDPPIDPARIPPRIFAPSVPFDPFSVPNLILVAAASGGLTITTPGPATDAAQLGRAIAAHPRDAPAILKNPAHAPPSVAFNPANSLVYETLAAAAYRDMQIASAYQTIQQASQDLQRRLALDLRTVEATNARIAELNGRVLPVLKLITGQDFGADPGKWRAWWADQLGYVYSSPRPQTKPTFTDLVSVQSPFTVGAKTSTACFAAGTRVLTLDGPQAIESIRVGDRVLAQDPTTGRLAFRPVLAAHRHEPAPTLRVRLDGESIIATGIHRFWKAGAGWAMARDLKPGDQLRVLGGTAEVRAIEAGPTQPVYNLDVAEDRDFFVGAKGFLVHDFSFVQPVLMPFDRPSPLESPDPPHSP